ncbi:MAG: sensor histidine kinase [Pseudomonadota bacterium]
MASGYSLRTKIAVSFAALGLVLVGLQALVTLYINNYQESQIIDQLVSDEMDALIEQYHRHQLLAPPRAETLRAYAVEAGAGERELRRWYRATWLTQRYVAHSAAERAGLPRELRNLEPGFHDVASGGERFRVEVRSVGPVTFFLAYDVTHHRNRVAQFHLLVAAAAAAAALAGAGLGLGLAGPLTRQVTDLANRVKRLRHGGPPEALAGHYPDREVAALARAFDDFQTRMASLLERERAFTADVSHELRNPLTAIQTSSELLLQGEDLPPKTRERVEKIARGAARLSELVNALLLLAREEAAGAGAEVDLMECLEEAVEPVQERLQAKGLQLLMDVPEDCRVRQPRNALLVVLSNLLVNAVSYTDQGSIWLRVRGQTIEIADTGRGVEPGQVADLFRRFYRGDTGRADGYGLGLAIVKRICDQSGWRIAIEPRAEGGTRVLLDLAPDLTKI